MKTLIALVFVSSSIAQTLSITPAGLVSLSPVPVRTAELYAADSPRAKHWEFVTDFTQSTRVDTTNGARFFRARVKAPPIRIVAILETNNTIRGKVDKRFTNALLIVEGKTNKGWCYDQVSIRTNNISNPFINFPLFSFPRQSVSNTTQATIRIWDADGFMVETNVLIGPGPFVPLRPPKNIRSLPFSQPPPLTPSSGSAEPDQQTASWWLIQHSNSEFYESGGICRDLYTFSKFNGGWDAAGQANRHTETRLCRDGRLYECGADWSGESSPDSVFTWMRMTSDYGDCNFPEDRVYQPVAEMGSYDSQAWSDGGTDKFTHTGNSAARMWIGGNLPGWGENYWVAVGCSFVQAVDRYGSEFDWVGVASFAGPSFFQVPPEGLLIDVTPTVPTMDDGWFRYGAWFVVSSSDEP